MTKDNEQELRKCLGIVGGGCLQPVVGYLYYDLPPPQQTNGEMHPNTEIEKTYFRDIFGNEAFEFGYRLFVHIGEFLMSGFGLLDLLFAPIIIYFMHPHNTQASRYQSYCVNSDTLMDFHIERETDVTHCGKTK